MSKQNLLKKALAITLAVILTVGIAPLAGFVGLELPTFSFITASAAEDAVTNAETGLIVSGNTIIGYDETVFDAYMEKEEINGHLIIPENINGVAITSIGDEAFNGCLLITEVTIPKTIKKIGEYAFQECAELETVNFNSNQCVMTAINGGCEAFAFNKKLTTFVFGENVSSISAKVCRYIASLETVTFLGKVTEIGEYAFEGCSSLKTIDLTKVTTIGNSAFLNCSNLSSIDGTNNIDPETVHFDFTENLTSIGDEAFNGCLLITEVTIPKTIKKIGEYAFQECAELETVNFNSNQCVMTAINGGREAFAFNKKLTTFVFGENVSSISAKVCRYIASLETVIFLGEVTEIGEYAFEGCSSLNNIHLAAYAKETFDFDSLTIGSGNDVVTEDILTFGIENKTETNDEFGVTISYINTAFDEEVKLSVTEAEGERENSSVYISDGEIREQIGCFNIKMVLADGSSTATVQPNGKVTVKMVVPENYIGKTNFRIVHRLENGQRENFATNPKGSEKKLSVSSDGKYWIFEVTSFSEFEFFAVKAAPTVSIKNNSGSKTINYGDILRLTANTSNMPSDARIFWYVDGVKAGEGTTFEISPESGSVEVTVKVVDTNGNDYADADISDSQKVTVKSGFFQKLINFFKNLFGISRIISQAFIIK